MPAPRKTAVQRVQEWPSIAGKEMVWLRRKPGQLRAAGTNRSSDYTDARHPRLFDRSVIHTHISSLGGADVALSPSDMKYLAVCVLKSRVRSMHILVVGDGGKVTGRVTYRVTPVFLKQAPAIRRARLEADGRASKEFVESISVPGILRIRYRPTPGYALDLASGCFKPKQA
ncbi:MAG: hypothetical protein AABW54_00505 [Candidatus Micrarchaeota archaeon]